MHQLCCRRRFLPSALPRLVNETAGVAQVLHSSREPWPSLKLANEFYSSPIAVRSLEEAAIMVCGGWR